MTTKIEFNLSEEEADLFDKFKKQMKELHGPEVADDLRLYRFLKARDFNIKQAEIMFKNHVSWRKHMKIDTILEDYKLCEVQEKYLRPSIIGFDKEGHLVTYVDVGNIDFKNLLKCAKASDYEKGFAYMLTGYEKLLEEQSKKLGKTVDKWISIMDCENFSMAQGFNKPYMDLSNQIGQMQEANFPERVEASIIINAPKFFYIIFNMFKHIIPKKTLEKFRFFGTDGWKEELLNLIEPEQLPAFLGGKKTDPDGNPLCPSLINFHKPIPKHYYFRSPERRLRGEEGTKEYLIKRMDKVEIVFDVNEPDSCIEWEFESESGDIAFGLFKKRDKAKPEPLIQMERVNAHQQIESGMFICKVSGIYILTFDNSYSWIREKKIFCKTSVKKIELINETS